MNFFSNIISGVANFFTPQAPSAPPVSNFSNAEHYQLGAGRSW